MRQIHHTSSIVASEEGPMNDIRLRDIPGEENVV